jgi:glutamyl-tRNA reductase
MRERLAFDDAAVPRALAAFREKFPQAEAVLLSTCNRMELYISRPANAAPNIADAINFLAEFHDLEPSQFAMGLYSYEDTETIRHLFRVVGSLDSMVLGESQILAQTKSAYEIARSAGLVHKNLDVLFQRAFAVAKDLHNQTLITTGRVSVGSTAVDLARQIFSRFDDKQVLMVGAGIMGELTLTHLMETQPKGVLVTSRTEARAAALARRITTNFRYTPKIVSFSKWVDHLAEVDIVISCTGSPQPILDAEKFGPIPARRRYRPLLLIDIAVPRDIDPAVGEYDSVFLYNIDDLQSVTEANLARRRESLEHCHSIIESHVVDFIEKQSRRDVGPLIEALQERLTQIEREEWQRIMPKLESMSEHDRELIEEMLYRISRKILHQPVTRLNDSTDDAANLAYADTLRALFNLKREREEKKF